MQPEIVTVAQVKMMEHKSDFDQLLDFCPENRIVQKVIRLW